MNRDEKKELVTSLEERVAYLEAMIGLEKTLGVKDGRLSTAMPFMEGYLTSGEERFYGSQTAALLVRLKAAGINTNSFPKMSSDRNLKDVESSLLPMFRDNDRKLSELEAKRYGSSIEAIKERIRWMKNELEAEQ